MNKERIVCFHHNDRDGFCAAAVVKCFRKDHEIVFVESDYYNKECREWIDKLTENDIVYIVDFSFSVEETKRIVNNSCMVIWIDHHESAIEKFKGTEFENLPGIRYSDKQYPLAGCELTWKYFSDDEIPNAIKLIGSYDTWRYTFSDEGQDRVLNFYFGAYDYLSVDKMFDLITKTMVGYILERGSSIKEYTYGEYKKYTKNAFEAEFEGHKILVLNSHIKSSLVFGDKVKEYPFVCVFNYAGEIYSYSLYTDKPNEYPVNKIFIAQGHAGAAGFGLDYNIFDKNKGDR